MRYLYRFIFALLFLLISRFGIGQTKEMPIISRIVNSYIDTLLKDQELSATDTLLITNNFDLESRFLKIPNFKKIDDSYLNGNYFILRYYIVDLKGNTLKLKIQLNTIKYTKLDKGTPSVEDLNSYNYDYYWITFDCNKNDWILKK